MFRKVPTPADPSGISKEVRRGRADLLPRLQARACVLNQSSLRFSGAAESLQIRTGRAGDGNERHFKGEQRVRARDPFENSDRKFLKCSCSFQQQKSGLMRAVDYMNPLNLKVLTHPPLCLTFMTSLQSPHPRRSPPSLSAKPHPPSQWTKGLHR